MRAGRCGLHTGLFSSLFFVATAMGVIYLFEQRPLRLWLINAGYQVVNFCSHGVRSSASGRSGHSRAADVMTKKIQGCLASTGARSWAAPSVRPVIAAVDGRRMGRLRRRRRLARLPSPPRIPATPPAGAPRGSDIAERYAAAGRARPAAVPRRAGHHRLRSGRQDSHRPGRRLLPHRPRCAVPAARRQHPLRRRRPRQPCSASRTAT